MVAIAGGAATEDSADPELIVSFGVFHKDTDEILLASFMGSLRARNASNSLIQDEVFLLVHLTS
jgi:hypothetical protein